MVFFVFGVCCILGVLVVEIFVCFALIVLLVLFAVCFAVAICG